MQQRWPDRLWVVRHGESIGNLASAQAKQAGLPALSLDLRDPDVPLQRSRRATSRGRSANGSARCRAGSRR